jgi:uncharacterized protein involved in type VI secretion and phage assembly
MDKSAAGLLPGIQGLVCGVVKDIVDPDGEYRVKVNIPFVNVDPETQAKNDDGVWARMVSADAGGGKRGILIRPEVDDEVIVGFVNNDPRNPVILGMVYSSESKHTVPEDLAIEASNKNKGWITLAETKFLIDDTADKAVVTVETKGGNKIVISDAEKSISITDQHKNEIVMNEDGITIHAEGNIEMTATKEILVEGTKDVTLNSKSGAMLAKGTKEAEFSSSGTAKLKGSMVNIN